MLKQYADNLVPFRTDIIDDLSALTFDTNSDNHPRMILQKLSTIIHPFTPKLRRLLQTNSRESLKYEFEEFEDKRQSKILLTIVGADLIKTVHKHFHYEKISVFDEILQNYRIEMLNNGTANCSEYSNCFDCLSNLACSWKYSTKQCFSQDNTTTLQEIVKHPSQCVSCETLQNCLICNSLQFCYWNDYQCNTVGADKPMPKQSCC